MKLLSLDTSTEYLTLAISEGPDIIARIHRKAPRSHSSLLMPTIARLLKKARLTLNGIDGICIGVGPGSFTGLRIGVATVKGLAFVSGMPIATVPTFDAIALNARKVRGTICVVLDARKNKVYGSFYSSDGKGTVKRASPYLLLPLDDLLKLSEKYDTLYFVGDYADKVPGAKIATARWHPRADAIAALGAERFRKKKFVKAEDLEPMYIYSKECDIKGY